MHSSQDNTVIPSPATIIIPIAPHHQALAARALESARAQTVTCDVYQVFDHDLRGAGWARNYGAAQCDTDFVVFLDADDVLTPTFVEACLAAYEAPRYVYTSWLCGESLRKPNLCVSVDSDYHSHLVTTLYPTAIFKALGGFDESLTGHEDVDFYLRSHRHGICGTHLDEPLLHYTEHGWRSKIFNERADKKAVMDDVRLRNGGQLTIMACCNQPGEKAQINPGQQVEGDVLATTLWAGMHSEVGHVTGRVYNGGSGSSVYIDPRDVAATPHLFQVKQDLRQLAPKREQVLRDSGLV